MKTFINENFLLRNKISQKLYHSYAAKMPIYDYHCHLNPQEIAEDKKYKNITEIWLSGDHYKWRAMRAYGIDEKYITGSATSIEKFLKWAETVSYAIGNPLYHWTHLELKRYFNIQQILNKDSAEKIWQQCNKKLHQNNFSAKNIIKNSKVKVICTTDDPINNLEYHQQIAHDKKFTTKVLPTFRPDKALQINQPNFVEWIDKLSKVVNQPIGNLADLQAALNSRIEYFHKYGCRISDHAMDPLVYIPTDEQKVEQIFARGLMRENLSDKETYQYRTFIMQFLGHRYAKYKWTMQLHVNTIRNVNNKMLHQLGPDTGFDAIRDDKLSVSLANFLDALNKTDQLPKTILYSLNPTDNATLAALIGCFQEGGIKGKIQFGSAWWLNDHIDGMRAQLKTLANIGMLSGFVGMLTDSRSFLSYTRHEYFRRTLCQLIGKWVKNNELPNDISWLGKIVQDICYNNADNYFGI
jgi:glucuronate isomerase